MPVCCASSRTRCDRKSVACLFRRSNSRPLWARRRVCVSESPTDTFRKKRANPARLCSGTAVCWTSSNETRISQPKDETRTCMSANKLIGSSSPEQRVGVPDERFDKDLVTNAATLVFHFFKTRQHPSVQDQKMKTISMHVVSIVDAYPPTLSVTLSFLFVICLFVLFCF